MRNFYADQKFILFLTNQINNSQANGKDENIIRVVCQDSTTLEPVTNIDVQFKVDNGSAVFSETQSNIAKAVTSTRGIAEVHVTDTVSEKVNITCTVLSDSASTASQEMSFRPATESFSITSARNINHTFLLGEPSIAWASAEFLIMTEGGSGKGIKWTIENNAPEVTVASQDTTTGVATFRGYPRSAITIIATDTLTNESDTYSFTIRHFINMSVGEVSLKSAIKSHGSYLLSPTVYSSMYKQWGDFTRYPIWSSIKNKKQNFWTNEYGLISATVFNISKGTLSEEGKFLNKHFYLYDSPEPIVKK